MLRFAADHIAGERGESRRHRIARLAAAALVPALLAWPAAEPAAQGSCNAPEPACAARDAVFRVSAFDPYGSAVRIGPDLLVTNRHIVADESTVEIALPGGETLQGEAVPSAYEGDLILVRADLPEGPALDPGGAGEGPLYTVGLDLSAKAVRVFPEGHVLKQPAPDKPYARLHHTAYSQPGASGGAVVDEAGRLVAVAASGGEGRFEAVPAAQIARLREMSGPGHAEASKRIGTAYRECTVILEKARRSRGAMPEETAGKVNDACAASGNRQLFDLAGQVLGRSRMFADSIAFFERALEKDPNAVNSRISLVITLIFAQRQEDALAHVRWLVDVIPESIQVQRFAVQVGKAGGDMALAERGLALIEKHNPQQLEAARRFLDSDQPQRPRPR